MRQSSPERALTVAQVRELGRYATQRRADGRIFEYDHGSFWVTHPLAARCARALVEDKRRIPRERWYHHSLCDCGVCRPPTA